METIKRIIGVLFDSARVHGFIDVQEICTSFNIPYATFKYRFLRNFECPDLEELGVLNLKAGIFYSYVWEEQWAQLKEADAAEIRSDFETSVALDLTKLANRRGENIDQMRILLFRYCGANNINGKVETAENGDYIVIPDPAFVGDFIANLDRFVQQAITAEKTYAGKKRGGKRR